MNESMCMYVSVCAYMCVCVCMYIYIHIYTYIYAYIYIYIYILYICVCVLLCIYICVYIYICIYVLGRVIMFRVYENTSVESWISNVRNTFSSARFTFTLFLLTLASFLWIVNRNSTYFMCYNNLYPCELNMTRKIIRHNTLSLPYAYS